MTEKIKCPCCGSEETSYPYGFWNEDKEENKLWCCICDTEWYESKRQPVSGWIRCSERMPENGQLCLIIFKELAFKKSDVVTCDLAVFDEADDVWWSHKYEHLYADQVTYWQPLPQPPVGKDKDND